MKTTWLSLALNVETVFPEMVAAEKDKSMFKIVDKSVGLEILFSAELENIDKIERATKNFLALNVTSEILFNILLLMREALNNAVYHGCELDKTKTVRYALKLKGHSIIMKIEDEGSGFDWYHMIDSGTHSDSAHGRGLAIMKKFSNEMKYNDEGSSLTLTIHMG